jgi:hypothetical protein
MLVRLTVIGCIIWSLPLSYATAQKGSSFTPDITKVVPAISDNVDLTLMMAGNAQQRWKRTKQFLGVLPDISSINPIDNYADLLNWLGVCAVSESIVVHAKEIDKDLGLVLTQIYRALIAKEEMFKKFRSIMAVVSLHPGGENHPLVDLSKQLESVSEYSRDGIRWLAGRIEQKKYQQDFRLVIQQALAEVHRRDGNWSELLHIAKSLCRQKTTSDCLAMQAEALFELGHKKQGEDILSTVDVTSKESEVAKLRLELLKAKEIVRDTKSPADNVKLIEVLMKLKEPWRVRKEFSVEDLISAADPKLDELYITSIMAQTLDHEAALSFGYRAQGRPYTSGFLARRIGAGLLKVFGLFYSINQTPDARAKLAQVIETVDQDLDLFHPTDSKLADLTKMNLALIGYIASQRDNKSTREVLEKSAKDFIETYPYNIEAVQLAFLLVKLGVAGPDVWSTVENYIIAKKAADISVKFLPLYSGVAIHQARKENKVDYLKKVLAWIDNNRQGQDTVRALLWKAHLLAVKVLVEGQNKLGAGIVDVVNAYEETAQSWNTDTQTNPKDPTLFCDAVSSVATLLMQGGGVEDAHNLVQQTLPLCQRFPISLALSAVMSLSLGKKETLEKDSNDLLQEVATLLSSDQVKVQAYLWLGMVAEAADNQKKARGFFENAAKVFVESSMRGEDMLLAPDLRSMIATFGAFNISAGYSDENPFGLIIEMDVESRMILFPPAAVDRDRLTSFVEKRRR